MADAFVTVLLQQLANILQAGVQQEARLLFGGEEEIHQLTKVLTAIRAVLNDAEKKQVKESSIKMWLEDLKSISYELDDLLDEWNTKIYAPKIQRMGKVKKSSLPKKMVRFSHFLSPFFCFNQTVMHHELGSKMKSIKERLDAISSEKGRYHFALGDRSDELERLETTPLIDVSEVCGRDLDKGNLINKLCDDIITGEIGSNGPLVVSIVGMGGMGKTTLAQLAFNNEKVDTHFDYKIWVCVSESFEKTRIAKMIIEATDILRPSIFWSELQKQLHSSVNGKKILLVLDDVRIDDFQVWEPIKIALISAAVGSRILVTTRNERASIMMEAAYMLPLGKLSPEDSWSLFSRYAFYGKSKEDCSNLEEIGLKIVDRCKGLPLAVKTLGSLMRFKETKQAWENVLDSELWELEEVERWIFAPLFVSYYDLPSPMKRCFTYCAIFPKDYRMDKDALIQHWMAQGFLVPTGSMDAEQKGAEYFDNLVMRSFFHDLDRDKDNDNKISCKMHDIVHDFAQFLTKNECFIMDVEERLDQLPTSARYLTLIGRTEHFHSSIYNFRNLRMLFALQKEIRIVPSDLLSSLKYVRGLDLSSTLIVRLPSEVGELLHLRLLNLSSLHLEELPNSVSNLYNLIILNLDCCKRLQKLPASLGRLINLRHLNLKETESLSILPPGVGKLSKLRTLYKFVVSENKEGCNIAELKNLKHLRGHLEISGLEKVVSVDQAKEADLTNKQLQSLDLVFSFGKKEVMENVIETLQPHPKLEGLQVYNYGGSIFPSWMTLLIKLKDLRLLSCINCLQLPPLGKLPCLEKLLIGHFNSLKSVGVELLGMDPVTDVHTTETLATFPKLKELTFRFMVEWEDWETITTPASALPSSSSSNVNTRTRVTMPCLRSLSLYDCPKLKAIPQDLRLIPVEELIITRCPILEQQSESSNI